MFVRENRSVPQLHFTTAENGWLQGTPSPSTIELAQARRRERDETVGPGTFICNYGVRWVGELSEIAVATWLAEGGVPFERHGGVDELPDFTVAATSVGVKCRTSQNAPFRSGYVVNVHDYCRLRPDRELLFCVYEMPPRNRLLIVGGMNTARFFELATYVAEGTPINPYRQASESTWNLEEHHLIRPAAWLRGLGTPVTLP